MNNWKIEDDKVLEWVDLAMKIPELNFDSSWNVRIIPPFTGALIRFMVCKGDKYCSVFLNVTKERPSERHLFYLVDFWWGVIEHTESDCQLSMLSKKHDYYVPMNEVEELMDTIKTIMERDDES